MAMLPLALLPDLAFGAVGQLRPVSFPADWDRVAEAIEADPGPVLSLPLSLYRSYSWNHRRPVIDPAPRYFDAEVQVDDTLLVGDLAVRGEDPRAAGVRGLMHQGEAVARSGVRWVLVQRDSGGAVPAGALAGLRMVYNGQFMTLYENPEASLGGSPPAPLRRWLILAANILTAGLAAAATWRLARTPTAW
jgi:hypothetical protein